MKRKLLFLILIAFCFYSAGCGDEGIESTLLDLGAAAPIALQDVGPVPLDIQEILWGKDVDTLMAELEHAIDINEAGDFTKADGTKVYDPDGSVAKSLVHKICYRRAREAYYGKYIDAGGIAIMGNKYLEDGLFYAARDIALGMTQKRPELREMLTPSRENRPGATKIDVFHDVTGLPTPSPKFFYVLVHWDMSPTSIPELQYGLGAVNYTSEGKYNGTASPFFAWSYVERRGDGFFDLYRFFSHELAHAIHFAINLLDPTFDDRLKAAHESFKEGNPLYSRNYLEYWAFGVTYWFMLSREEQYKEFREDEPVLYVLLEEWFDPVYLGGVQYKY